MARERLRGWVHGLKRRVVRRPRVRSLLRRLVVTPVQLHQLGRVAARLPAPRAPEREAPVVLVLALRPWAISRAWEAVLSRLLAARGCRVVWAVCDRLVPRCDAMLGEAREPWLCPHCARFNRRVASIFGFERVVLSELVGSAPEEAWQTAGARLGESDPELAAAVRPSLQRILGARPRPAGELTAAEQGIRDDLLLSAELVRLAAGPLLARLRPALVLALNGKFYAEALVLAAAARQGIPVWTYERGNRRDTVVLARAPEAVPFASAELIAGLDQPLAPAERARIEDYLHQRAEVGNGQVRFLAAGPRAEAPFGAHRGRLFSLFTNLIWDSAVVGEDTLFSDMFEWIATAIEEVARDPAARLVIRVHPAEVRVYWHPTRERVRDVLRERFPEGLPANVALVDADEPVDSYALMARSDLVLVYASTVGMEAAAMGRRVVAAANSSFARAPFVVRPTTREEFLAELRAGRTSPPVPDAPELARRFMYRLFFESMAPVPWVREDPSGFHAGPASEVPEALGRRLEEMLSDARRGASGGARTPASRE